jgi:tRNA (guanine-N7-)-methyltransferase
MDHFTCCKKGPKRLIILFSEFRKIFKQKFTFVVHIMGHKKLIRFNAINTFENVLQYPESMPGQWNEFFKNEHPMVLELACGRGEYSVGMGRQVKDKNFIGVDVKGNRMYNGAKIALQEQLSNVGFLRIQIENILNYFARGEVDEIWIIFPDPFLRDGKAKNRLTHPKFLAMYQQLLKPGAKINLKTDSPELFQFTIDTVQEQGCEVHVLQHDIYAKGPVAWPLSIQTYYEGLHLADQRKINFISFSLPEKPIVIPPKKKKEDGQ